jgi:hypothetical protein
MTFRKIHLLTTNCLGIILLVLIAISTSGYAETASFKPDSMTMEFHGEMLTAMIQSTPLKQVLKKFSQSTGTKVIWQGRETERMIQVRFTDLPIVEAVRRILRNDNYILYYTSTKGKGRLERILIVPRSEGEEKVLIAKAVPEARMFAIDEEPEGEIPEWHTIGPDDYDQQEFIADLEEQLVLQGDTEALEAIMQMLAREPNLYKEE